MVHFPVLDMSTGLNNLEPAKVVECLGRTGDSLLYRILDARLRGADDFHYFVDVILHFEPFPAAIRRLPARAGIMPR